MTARTPDAEPLLTAAQITLEERVAPDHPAMAASLASLARVTLARGDAAEAEKAARRAVDIVSRNPHRRSTEPLRALGAALAAEERFAEAAEVLHEALAEDRQHHGSDGADTARSLSQLANAELRSHRFAEALPLIQQAVAIEQDLKLFPPLREAVEHPGQRALLAEFLAKANLLVDQLHGGLGPIPQFLVAVEELLGKGTLAPAPALGHLLGQARGQGIGRGRTGRKERWGKGGIGGQGAGGIRHGHEAIPRCE